MKGCQTLGDEQVRSSSRSVVDDAEQVIRVCLQKAARF